MRLELETFTPSEAEAITNVTQATVRNWRRAGYLDRRKGHARYNIADLLVMFTIGMLVSRGITVEAAKGFSGETARALFQNFLGSTKAFAPELHDVAKRELGEVPAEKIDRVRELLGESFDLTMLETFEALDLLIRSAEQAFGVSGVKRPAWLIIWADDSMEFLYDDEEAHEAFFGNIQYGYGYAEGPIILFCLGALAQMVIGRLPRPAIKLWAGS